MDPVTAGAFSYPDSVDSSPRSRGGESWEEPYATVPGPKLRLMCSYGGRIVPRPTDKSLCYLGGETRIVVVERNSSLSDLHSKLSRSLLPNNNSPFTLKYQLPNEDLDSLISLTTDEDLDNMIDEFDRLQSSSSHSSNSAPGVAGGGGGANKSSRIRLFVFPTKPESAPSSIGSLLDDSKSETWFVDALNGAMGIGIDGLPAHGSTDSASVNCLLGLEDDSSVRSRAGVGSNNTISGVGGVDADRMVLPRPDSLGKLGRQVQDVNSVPDSPMLETTSSFGSTSSAPSQSNLPPIQVKPDDRPPDGRYGNLEEHFQQMNLNISSAVQSPPMNPPPPTISPSENPNSNRAFTSDDEKSDARKALPQQQVSSQLKPSLVDPPVTDSRFYYQEMMMMPPPPPPAAQLNLEPKQEIPVPDPAAAYRVQQVPMPVPESNYMMPTISASEQLHPQVQQQQQQQQQQPQYIHANPQYVQLPSYYHQVPHPMQQSQAFDPSIPMYYIPIHQNPPPVSAGHPKVTPKPELQPTMYRSSAAPPAQMMHPGMGYHVMHHHHPSQAAPASLGPQFVNYGYEYASHAAAPDAMHQAQVYYTQQTTSPPSMPAQYQTVISEELKQNRPS